MKSYLQGMITGGVMVFATIVFMGSSSSFPGQWRKDYSTDEVGRYQYIEMKKEEGKPVRKNLDSYPSHCRWLYCSHINC